VNKSFAGAVSALENGVTPALFGPTTYLLRLLLVVIRVVRAVLAVVRRRRRLLVVIEVGRDLDLLHLHVEVHVAARLEQLRHRRQNLARVLQAVPGGENRRLSKEGGGLLRAGILRVSLEDPSQIIASVQKLLKSRRNVDLNVEVKEVEIPADLNDDEKPPPADDDGEDGADDADDAEDEDAE